MLDEAGSDVIKMKKIKTTDLRFDKNNANEGTDRGRELLSQSLSKLGAGRSIVCDKHGTVIGGNKTLASAQNLGLEIEVIHTQGDKLVAVIRDDLDLESDPRARELALADNRIAELDLNWDVEQLLQDVDELTIEGLWSDAELERLQDSLDLATFEQMATTANLEHESDSEDEDENLGSKPESNMLPFHCLLTQQQRQRLFDAINQAKQKHGLETTADALDAITQEYLR